MNLIAERSQLAGEVRIPSSKSNTIRALTMAALADGISEIHRPLDSADTRSCVAAFGALGAEISTDGESWEVKGVAGQPHTPAEPIDVGNSGTTLYFLLSAAALAEGPVTITGDDQTRRRSAAPLVQSLNDLGARIETRGANGCAPFVVRGRLRGGQTSIACPTSQYLSSLLLSCPLAAEGTVINVTKLNEEPYVEMTLSWLNRADIDYAREGMKRFEIVGGQAYEPFRESISADFSSAAFFACAAALTGSELMLQGLDMNDAQGDKAVMRMLRQMGAAAATGPGHVRVKGAPLRGAEFDLNATPDLLPVMAVTACFAEGETRLINVPQARIKETDRISVMRQVLTELGGKVEELEDGLVIHHSPLHGGKVNGHGDHRVVMALAVGGLAAAGPIEVTTAEAVGITFPNFVELMQQAGGKVRITGD